MWCFRWLVCVVLVGLASQTSAQTLSLEKILDNIPKPKSSPQLLPPKSVNYVTISELKINGAVHVPKKLISNALLVPIDKSISNFMLYKKIMVLSKLGLFKSVTYDISTSNALVINVVENPMITAIKFEGNKTISAKELSNGLKTKVGDILNNKTLGKDLRGIEAILMSNGYLLSKVLSADVSESGEVTFRVSEGIIEAIEITGNIKTQDYVIRRELQSKIAKPFVGATFKEDLRRIFNLGYFEGLDRDIIPGEGMGSYILRILVKEKPSNTTLSFGGTYQQVTGLSFFSNFFWDNLFGHGQTLMLNGQFGQANVYQFKYINPWMWDDRKSLSIKLWRRRGNVDTLSIFNNNTYEVGLREENTDGAELGFGIPLSYDLRTHHYVLFENVSFEAADESMQEYTKQAYRFSISLDERDNYINPTTGKMYKASIEKGFGMYASSLVYYRLDTTLLHFFEVQKNEVLATRLRIGYFAGDHSDNENLIARERYRVGGSYTVRGYQDTAPFAVGTRTIFGNIEYRFLIGQSLQFIVFVDGGLATDEDKITLRSAKVTSGMGVRFFIPGLGPVRLDLGIPKLDSVEDTIVHFSIGHTF